MIKSLKGIMGSIDGVEVYPIVSLLVFFIFFVVLGWYVLTLSKKHINKMKQIPLENDATDELDHLND
jgi:cytochrome c oxidase cbb3-type subunit 4